MNKKMSRKISNESSLRIPYHEPNKHKARKAFPYCKLQPDLPNRLLLQARLNKSIEEATLLKQRLAVFFIDIDNFKLINDTYGHSIGDRIINLVAKRLQKNIRKNDTISRIGGDEFIIVIENLNDKNDIKKIAQNILDDFKEPVIMEQYLFDITISIGISVFPENGLNDEDLIKHADTAMYSAKNLGKNQYLAS